MSDQSEPRYLIIDTETTGLIKYGEPAEGPNQPRLAHLTMIALVGDRAWMKTNAYVRPDGWTMPADLQRVHGLTTEILNEKGIPIRGVLDLYAYLLDAGHVVVAFNAPYDLKVMRGELRRAGMADRAATTPSICTMAHCVDLCRLPYPSGREGYKFPKLREAMEHFGLQQRGEHNALDDANACLAIFRKLQESGIALNPALLRDAS